MRYALIAIMVLLVFCSAPAMAQDESEQPAEQAGGSGDLRSAVQNPISSLISLPFKFTFDYGASNGEASFLNIQPVIPVTVGDWNLVNRVIVPLIDTDGEVRVRGVGVGTGGHGRTAQGFPVDAAHLRQTTPAPQQPCVIRAWSPTGVRRRADRPAPL